MMISMVIKVNEMVSNVTRVRARIKTAVSMVNRV